MQIGSKENKDALKARRNDDRDLENRLCVLCKQVKLITDSKEGEEKEAKKVIICEMIR